MEEAQSITLDSVYPTPAAREVMIDKIRKERKVFHYEHEARKITGETIFIDQNTVGEFDDDDNLVLMRGHIMDITDRKKADQAIRQSEERYRSVVEDSPVLLCSFLPDGEITFVNTAYCKYFGKTSEELVGANFKSLIPEEGREAVLNNILSLTVGSGLMTHEHKVTAPDGQIRWQRWTNRALFDEQDRAVSFQSFGEDITEQRQAEEELETYRGEMARMEQLASLGTLSATVAHELTQPLTVIQLSIENALDELEGTCCPKTVNNKLRTSIAEISSITAIAERFRGFARRSVEPSIGEVDLQAIGERIVDLLSRAARQTRTSLLLEGMGELPHIEGNEKDLEQLFFALIHNAISAGDATSNRNVVVSGEVKDDQIELRFSDTCGGIPSENLDRIFEPFFTTRPPGQGTGLGLCVVQDIVNRAGGTIRVESRFGEGSTFSVRLPVGRNMKS
jgi:PAS domain S-box-containing protein